MKKCRACGPGESMSEQGRCLPGLNGEGGGGGGGKGGGAGAPASPWGNSMSLLNFQGANAQHIWDNLLGMEKGPWSPEVLAGAEGQLVGAREGAIDRAKGEINQDAISRGMFGSGSTQQSLLQARMMGEQQFGSELNKLRTTATLQNYQSKMQALDREQKWLDEYRNYAATLDRTQASREAAAAGIALGYAQIEAQKEMLQSQLGLGYAQLDFQKDQNTICIGGNCMPWNQFYGTYGS